MNKKIFLISIAISCLLTGCYPGNVQLSDAPHESSIENNGNISSNDASNTNAIVESHDEKLHIRITDSDLRGYDFNQAYTNIAGYPLELDVSKIKELFCHDSIFEKTVQYTDGPSGYLWELPNNGYVNYFPGTLTYETAQGRMLLNYADTYSEYMTSSVSKDVYPVDELASFTKEQALSIVKKDLDALGLSVGDHPLIYAMDQESMNKKRDDYLTQHPDEPEEECILQPVQKEDEAYRICYHLLVDDIPIVPVDFTFCEITEGILRGGYVSAIVTKEGLQELNCMGLMRLDFSNAQHIEICSAAAALNEVQQNLESTVLSTDIYLESIEFGYSVLYEASEKWTLIPMWTIGERHQASTTINDTIYMTNVSTVHFVKAENGKER